MSNLFEKPVSRRAALIAVAGAAPLLALGAAKAGLPKSAVKYVDDAPQAKQDAGTVCGKCKFFQAPKSCKSVAGDISSTGWCSLYVKA